MKLKGTKVLIIFFILALTQMVMGEESSRDLVNRLCGHCHATVMNGNCVAGDCSSTPIFRAERRNWNLLMDHMIYSVGCRIAPRDQRTIVGILESKFPSPKYPIAWIEMFTMPVSLGWNVVSLSDWKDHLYLGTEGGGTILRSPDGMNWDNVAETDHDKVYGFVEFKNNLYAGGFDPTPQIWRTMDGRNWKKISALPDNQKGITSLGTFKNFLYAGTAAAKVFRSEDGIHWKEAGVLKTVQHPAWPYWIRFLVEFRGRLYAGLEGGGVFHTMDGMNWVEVKTPFSNKTGVRGVTAFKDYLYTGTTGTGEIWRTRNGLRWERVFLNSNGGNYLAAMTVFNGGIYASLNRNIFRSFDGVNWAPVGEIGPKTVEAMTEFKGNLYAGNDRPAGAQIYRTSGISPNRISSPFKEISISGKVKGSLEEVQTGFQLFEIFEPEMIGESSHLDHKWVFEIPGGPHTLFAVRGYQSTDKLDDDFIFSYSLDDQTYVQMIHQFPFEKTRRYQFFTLPALPAGKFYVRVQNKNREKGGKKTNQLYIDHLFILTEGENPKKG